MKRNLLWVLLLLSMSSMLAGCSNNSNNAGNKNKTQESIVEESAAPKYEIPNVVGCTEQKAKAQLDKIGVKYQIFDDDYSTKYKKGLIYNQSVVGATDNDTIMLYRSKGLSYYIDSLNGKQYKDIKKQLKKFKIDIDYTYSTDYGKGKVVNCSFSGTEMHKGESGSLTLSNGKYSEKKVVGVDVNKAKKQFPGAKFKIKYKRSSAKKNKVLSYKVGSSTNKDKVPVTLTLSNAMIVKVPNVVGKSEDEAVRIMNKKGIKFDILNRYRDLTSKPTEAESIVEDQSGVGKRSRNETVILAVEKPAITISSMAVIVGAYGQVDTKIELKNESNRSISSVTFMVAYYNRAGEKVNTYNCSLKYVGPLSEGSWDESYWDGVLFDETTAAIKPLSATVKFMTGDTQTITFQGMFWHTSDYAGGSTLRD